MGVKCITVEIRGRMQSSGSVKLEISHPESDMDEAVTNEWPIILNALGNAEVSQWRERSVGFPYTFGDFVFGE